MSPRYLLMVSRIMHYSLLDESVHSYYIIIKS